MSPAIIVGKKFEYVSDDPITLASLLHFLGFSNQKH